MRDQLQAGFRVRLRARLGKALMSEENALTFEFDEREVTLKAQERDQPLREAKWLVFSARGFDSEADARRFGERLRCAVDVAGVCTSNGINTGTDAATTWISEDFARQIGMIAKGERVAPNTHGVSVHPDDDLTRFPVVNAQGVVTAQADGLLEALEELSGQALDLGDARAGIRLLNLAVMENQPLARLVLALSAVEALSEEERWTSAQAVLIDQIATQVERASEGDEGQLEVAEAIRKNLFRLSIRQGVKRVLKRLDLQSCQKSWDRLYGVRSGIFHGTVSLDESEIHAVANETVTLCGKIILALAHERGLSIPTIARLHYQS